jgi:hypothetical protein
MVHFVKTYRWLYKYNPNWLPLAACHDLRTKNKSYNDATQWNEKEMKGMSCSLLGVVTQSLQGGSATPHPIFNHAIECTQALLPIYMYARYNPHHVATVSYMDNALPGFHTFKYDF